MVAERESGEAGPSRARPRRGRPSLRLPFRRWASIVRASENKESHSCQVHNRLRGWLAAIIAFAMIGGGVARAQAPVSESQLETFLGLNTGSGLSSGDLTNLGNGPVTGGSAIMQSITVSARSDPDLRLQLSDQRAVRWRVPVSAQSIRSRSSRLQTLATIADNGFNFNPPIAAAPGTGYLYQTGYQSETIMFPTAGTYSLGIGVVNVTTDQFSSALLLDNFSLSGGSLTNGSFSSGDFSGWLTIGQTSIQTSSFGINPTNGRNQALLQTASVPEPSSIVLLVLGGLGAGIACRYRQKARAIPKPR